MTHEFDGAKYEKASTHQKEWGRGLISELNLTGTERVLDLGCGDGVLTARIAELVPRGAAVGIDSSPSMIATAKQHAAPNLRFILMDIADFDFEDEFDVIFSNATLHWVHDHRAMLRSCLRALTAGGTIRFNFAGDGNCSNLNGILQARIREPAFAGHFEGFRWPWYMPPVEEYRTLAEGGGFSSVQVWGQNLDRFFASREEMIRWIDQPSLVPFLAHLDPAHRELFRDAVVADMVRVCEQPDGRCFEQFRRINVSARKP